MIQVFTQAITQKRLIQFIYKNEIRIVEPHMLAHNERNHLSLSAWWVGGYSQSGSSPHWREYLLAEVSGVQMLSGTFDTPRPGYKRDGGSKFHDILAAV